MKRFKILQEPKMYHKHIFKQLSEKRGHYEVSDCLILLEMVIEAW